MNPEPFTAAATAVGSISNYWQVIALVIIGAFGVFALWITRIGGESKKMVALSDELEAKRTETRKLERDKQMSDMEGRVMAVVDGQRHALDIHIDGHRERDTRFQNSVEQMDVRLRQIEMTMVKSNAFTELQADVKKMQTLVTRIHTILEVRDSQERSTSRGKRDD